MRSSITVSVLFAAGVLATPLLGCFVLVTKEVVVTVTDYVTAGAAQVPSTSKTSTSIFAPVGAAQRKAAADVPVPYNKNYRHHRAALSQAHVVAPAPSTFSKSCPAPVPSSSSSPYFAALTTEETTTSTPQSYVVLPETTTSLTPSPVTTSSPTQVQSANSNLPTTAVPNLDTASDVYKGLAVQHHNVHRQNHSASDMAWNETLAGYAEQVARTCFARVPAGPLTENSTPGGGGYGQNIAAGIAPGRISEVVSNMWYNGEESLFPTPYGNDSPDMSNFAAWGHFSQLVWSETESVGCYTSTCSPAGQDPQTCKPDGTSYLSGLPCGHGTDGEAVGDPAYFTVCNYYPAGKPASKLRNLRRLVIH